MDRTGIENQSELRAAINAAVRANLAIYTMDIRGLQALVPGGEAQSRQPARHFALLRPRHAERAEFEFHHPGNAGHAGRRHRRPRLPRHQRLRPGLQARAGRHCDLLHAGLPQQQSRARRQVPPHHGAGAAVPDSSSTTAAAITLPPISSTPRARTASASWMRSWPPICPPPICPSILPTGYFRLADNKFFVPVSLVVPGSEIPFTRGSDQDKATLDVLGAVLDDEQASHHLAARHRQVQRARIAGGAPQERAVQQRLRPARRQVSSEVCGAREPERAPGLVRDRPHRPRTEDRAAEDEFGGAGQPAPARRPSAATTTRWSAMAPSSSPT